LQPNETPEAAMGVTPAALHFLTASSKSSQYDKNIVFCGDKSIIRADFMIDDSVPNLTGFTGQAILFTAPHNVLDTAFPRVDDWLDVADYFGIVEAFV
jgi:5'(3')-deoxyribonucleotidase